MQKYHLTQEEIDYIFDNYNGEYQDRGIIAYVFNDIDEYVEEEKFSLGYDNVPYFDNKKFGEDLLEEEYNLKLENGRIVLYNY